VSYIHICYLTLPLLPLGQFHHTWMCTAVKEWLLHQHTCVMKLMVITCAENSNVVASKK
jgi:hypothetical protein